MSRLRYPHHLQPIAPLFCCPTFVSVDLTFASTLMPPPFLTTSSALLRIDSQLPKRLRPLLVGISACEVICVAVAYQHTRCRLAYEVLERTLVRPGVECGEQPARAEWVRY